MRFLSTTISAFSAIVIFAYSANAQLLNFSPGNLPQCAQGCTNLQNAQNACVPPEAAQATQQEYNTCFCQSAYLQSPPLKQTGAGVCPACTSSSDQQQMQQWYVKLCTTGQGAGKAAAGTSSAASTPTSAAGASATSTSAQGFDTSGTQPTWWDQHGRWIAMIIVLIVGFALIAVIGIFVKRRYNARRNRASATPLPSSGWGPNVDPHSYPGPVEKDGATVETTATPPSSSSTTGEPPQGRSKGSKRLSKFVPGKH